MIEFEDFSFTYQGDIIPTLKNINLKINKGGLNMDNKLTVKDLVLGAGIIGSHIAEKFCKKHF